MRCRDRQYLTLTVTCNCAVYCTDRVATVCVHSETHAETEATVHHLAYNST